MVLIKENKQYYVQQSWNNPQNRVRISRKLYLIYMRPIWREEKREKREKKCRDEGTKRCSGDCSRCWVEVIRQPLSLEEISEKGNLPPSLLFPSPEAQMIRRELSRALYNAICTLDCKTRAIILLFSEGKTEREIADIVGPSQKTVNNRKRESFLRLKELLKDYADFYYSKR